jgi:hypothetical protein
MGTLEALMSSDNPSLDLINRALSNIRLLLLKNPIAKEICSDLDFDKRGLYGIPISFSDEIDVAAKTINSNIILNVTLLREDFSLMMRYVIHELVHAIQHINMASLGDPYDQYEYLDRPDEVEAFQYQVKFEDEYGAGEEDAIEYVEELIDYHDIDGGDAEDKKELLLDKVSRGSINKK